MDLPKGQYAKCVSESYLAWCARMDDLLAYFIDAHPLVCDSLHLGLFCLPFFVELVIFVLVCCFFFAYLSCLIYAPGNQLS